MLPCLFRVFHGLPGKFVTAQVLSFAMFLGCGLVGVGGEKVKFGGSLMGVFHTSILLPEALGLFRKRCYAAYRDDPKAKEPGSQSKGKQRHRGLAALLGRGGCERSPTHFFQGCREAVRG